MVDPHEKLPPFPVFLDTPTQHFDGSLIVDGLKKIFESHISHFPIMFIHFSYFSIFFHIFPYFSLLFTVIVGEEFHGFHGAHRGNRLLRSALQHRTVVARAASATKATNAVRELQEPVAGEWRQKAWLMMLLSVPTGWGPQDS